MRADLNDVAVFLEVVAEEGFTAAARKLDLPTSAVSRRVARLEERLGVTLLHRTTRQVGLTDLGRVFHERVAGLSRMVEEGERALAATQQQARGVVRMTAPPDDGGVIWRLVEGFVAAHPEVDLEILHTLEYVDLIAENIDVALRGGEAPDSTLFTAHELLQSRILLCASPAYLAGHGTPERVEDLERHTCVGMDTWAPNAIRRLDGSSVRLTLRNRVRTNRLDTVQSAVEAGIRIGPLLGLNVHRQLASGELVEVLRGALPMRSSMWAIYPIGRKGTAAARALVSHLMKVGPTISGTGI